MSIGGMLEGDDGERVKDVVLLWAADLPDRSREL